MKLLWLANWCCSVKIRWARHTSSLKAALMWRWYVRYRGCDRERHRRIGWWWSGHCARDGLTGRSGDPQTGASWCSARATGRSWAAGAVSTRPNFRPASAALNPSRNENSLQSPAPLVRSINLHTAPWIWTTTRERTRVNLRANRLYFQRTVV